MIIIVTTTEKRQVVDITDKITREVIDFTGYVNVFVQHTTAAITTADLDPGAGQDLLDGIAGMLPDLRWQQPHDPAHAPDHILASIIGPSVTIPVKSGQLQLGTWQRVVLVEFNGAQERQVEVGLLGSQNADPNLML